MVKIHFQGYEPMPVPMVYLIIFALISVAIPVTLYLLRSFALYKMAKTENLNKAYFAFIPFLWTYIAGKIAGTPLLMGKPIKKFALLLLIFFSVSEITSLIYELLIYIPVLGYILQGGEVVYAAELSNSVANELYLEGYQQYLLAPNLFVLNKNFINVPYAKDAFIYAMDITSFALLPVDIISIALSITMYVGVFKKYWPLHYTSAVIFSVFGLFPIFAFIVRKNQPVDYNKFMRERFARYTTYSPYNNPYNATPTQNTNNDNPFNEFTEKKEKAEDPFSEFNNDKDEK